MSLEDDDVAVVDFVSSVETVPFDDTATVVDVVVSVLIEDDVRVVITDVSVVD